MKYEDIRLSDGYHYIVVYVDDNTRHVLTDNPKWAPRTIREVCGFPHLLTKAEYIERHKPSNVLKYVNITLVEDARYMNSEFQGVDTDCYYVLTLIHT